MPRELDKVVRIHPGAIKQVADHGSKVVQRLDDGVAPAVQ